MKLDMLPEERAALRRHGLRAASLPGSDPQAIAELCLLPLERCRYLVAMADFQTLGSVGPAAAQDLWDLGCRSLPELTAHDPVRMYQALCVKVGVDLDPCVEDVFRCAIAQVRDPNLPVERRNWWVWKPLRGQPMGEGVDQGLRLDV